MNKSASHTDRILTRAALAWVAACVALALGWQPLVEALWFLALLFPLIAVVSGVVILVVALVRVRRRARRGEAAGRARAVAIGVAVAFVAGWFASGMLVSLGDALAFRVRWARERPTYELIIADVRSGALRPDATKGTFVDHRGARVAIEGGSPLRVAFLHTGFLDNWEGVVYDPTGAVAAATGWHGGRPGEFTASSEILALFGGDLVRCELIERPYYRCWFT